MGNPWEIAVLDDLAMVSHAHIQPILPVKGTSLKRSANIMVLGLKPSRG